MGPTLKIVGATCLALAALLSLGALAACKVGKSERRTYSIAPTCTAASESCLDPGTARLCADRKLATFACRGPGGCRIIDGHVFCDRSRAQAGDRCYQSFRKRRWVTCSVDERSELECRDGTWVQVRTCARSCRLTSTFRGYQHLPIDAVTCE